MSTSQVACYTNRVGKFEKMRRDKQPNKTRKLPKCTSTPAHPRTIFITYYVVDLYMYLHAAPFPRASESTAGVKAFEITKASHAHLVLRCHNCLCHLTRSRVSIALARSAADSLNETTVCCFSGFEAQGIDLGRQQQKQQIWTRSQTCCGKS